MCGCTLLGASKEDELWQWFRCGDVRLCMCVCVCVYVCVCVVERKRAGMCVCLCDMNHLHVT